MDKYTSPLRYPGGKTALSDLLRLTLEANGLRDAIYAEPFAGGAGAALKLLFGGHVDRIVLNDVDTRLYCFWRCVLYKTNELIALIEETPLTLAEYAKQRAVLFNSRRGRRAKELETGFATFFLNRCNRSGILRSGPIGGYDQRGKWKIGARFNRHVLIEKIKKIGAFRDRIELHNADAVTFLRSFTNGLRGAAGRCLIYLDPPYVGMGEELYGHFFSKKDHARLARFLQACTERWVASYDDVASIRGLYSHGPMNSVPMEYAVYSARIGTELVISGPNCVLPQAFTKRGKVTVLEPVNRSTPCTMHLRVLSSATRGPTVRVLSSARAA